MVVNAMNSCPTSSIIVINYNGKKFLERCLSSLGNLNYPNYEVILVDNASVDGSVEFVKKLFPWVKVVENKRNEGFAEGSNIGFRHAKGDFIVFMNNDIEAHPDFLKEMVKTVRSDSSIGICGCKLLLFDNRNVIDTVGGFFCDIYGYCLFRIGVLEVDHHQYDLLKTVFVVTGGCMLVKREVLEKIGGFDSKYLSNQEELDLCWRAQLAGYKIMVNPLAVVYHKGGGWWKPSNSSSRAPVIRFITERNTLRTLIKNYKGSTLLKVLPKYFSLLIAEIVLFLLIGKIRFALADIKSVMWNIYNFRDSWRTHKRIQQMRVIDDYFIQKRMFKNCLKIDILKTLLLESRLLHLDEPSPLYKKMVKG